MSASVAADADAALAVRHVAATIFMYLLPGDVFHLGATSKQLRELQIAWAERMYVEQDNYQEAFLYSDDPKAAPALRSPIDPLYTSSYSANMLLFCVDYGRFKRARDSIQSKLKARLRISTTLTNFAAILAGVCGVCKRRWMGSLSVGLGLHACGCARDEVKNVVYYSAEENAIFKAARVPTVTYEGYSGGSAYSRGAYLYECVWVNKHAIVPPQWVAGEVLEVGFEEARAARVVDVQKRVAEEVAMQRGLAELRAAEEPQRRAIAAQLRTQKEAQIALKKAAMEAALVDRLQKLRAHKQLQGGDLELGGNLDIIDELVSVFASTRPMQISLSKGAFGNFFTPVQHANRSMIKIVCAVKGMRAVWVECYGLGLGLGSSSSADTGDDTGADTDDTEHTDAGTGTSSGAAGTTGTSNATGADAADAAGAVHADDAADTTGAANATNATHATHATRATHTADAANAAVAVVPISLREVVVRCAGMEQVSVQAVREQQRAQQEQQQRAQQEQQLRVQQQQEQQRMQELRQKVQRREQEEQICRERKRRKCGESCKCGNDVSQKCTQGKCGNCCDDEGCRRHTRHK
jgi:hypothetical protein